MDPARSCESLQERVRTLEAEVASLRAELAASRQQQLVRPKKSEQKYDPSSQQSTLQKPEAKADPVKRPPVLASAHSHSLTAAQIRRYGRHLVLPWIGVKGQERICASRVLVVGAGGLGCPCLLYLAGAGVKQLGIVDGDTIDSSNLHRQVLYAEGRVGEPKAEAAKARCEALNPSVDCRAYTCRLTQSNAAELIQAYDLVIDCTDDVTSRYLIASIAASQRKFVVCGAAQKLDGQVALMGGGKLPCYRCLYPDPTGRTQASCSDTGVLGVVPGIIGCLQALEAVKLIARGMQLDQPSNGSLLIFDAVSTTFHKIRLGGRRTGCVCCDTTRSGKDEIKCAPSCGAGPQLEDSSRVSPQGYLRARSEQKQHHILLDVREPVQFRICSLSGAINVPISKIRTGADGVAALVDREVAAARAIRKGGGSSVLPIYCICRRGVFSSEAVQILQDRRMEGVRFLNIDGGLTAWSAQVDATFPVY